MNVVEHIERIIRPISDAELRDELSRSLHPEQFPDFLRRRREDAPAPIGYEAISAALEQHTTEHKLNDPVTLLAEANPKEHYGTIKALLEQMRKSEATMIEDIKMMQLRLADLQHNIRTYDATAAALSGVVEPAILEPVQAIDNRPAAVRYLEKYGFEWNAPRPISANMQTQEHDELQKQAAYEVSIRGPAHGE